MFDDLNTTTRCQLTDFGRRLPAPKEGVDGLGNIFMQGNTVPCLDLNDRIKRGGRLAFEDGLLGAAATGLFVAESDRLNAADEVREGRVQHEVFECVAMGRADELDTALSDGAGGVRFQLGADFIDDDNFGHVVFDGFDHDGVLKGGRGHLHPAGAADRRVRDVAISGYFVGRVDDDHTLSGIVGKHAGDLTEHGGLADAGPAKEEDALATGDEVFDDTNGAVDRAANAAG